MSGNSNDKGRWYVVYTKPKQESIASVNLVRQGYVVYCPRTQFPKRKNSKWLSVTEPLFPRYIFIKLSVGLDDFAPIRSTKGAVSLVRFGGRLATISSEAIECICEQEQLSLGRFDPFPQWQSGDVVEVVSGPFAGIKAIFQRASGEERVMVMFDLLGRSNAVEVDVHGIVAV